MIEGTSDRKLAFKSLNVKGKLSTTYSGVKEHNMRSGWKDRAPYSGRVSMQTIVLGSNSRWQRDLL